VHSSAFDYDSVLLCCNRAKEKKANNEDKEFAAEKECGREKSTASP
jgi:hypothetical protein